jgi:pSer/pThr/pTyr-binding forkhead associated (FHA) protein
MMIRYDSGEPLSGSRPSVGRHMITDGAGSNPSPAHRIPNNSSFSSARSEENARLCGRWFARNNSGETYCKMCGEPLPAEVEQLDQSATRRLEAPAVRGTVTVHIEQDGSEIDLPIDTDVVLIGRASVVDGVYPDVDLAPFDQGNYVSRRHAFIVRRHGSFIIEDLESTNGTSLNGAQRLVPHAPTPLRHGDKILFGQTKVTFTVETVPQN